VRFTVPEPVSSKLIITPASDSDAIAPTQTAAARLPVCSQFKTERMFKTSPTTKNKI
jgi:hypothetical protein